MSDSTAKKSEYVRVSAEDKLFLKQLALKAQIENGGVEVPMGVFVAEALALYRKSLEGGVKQAAAQQNLSPESPDKELQQVIDFWAVAPKEDRHIVLSIVKRWLPDGPGESSKKLNEKRR